MNIEENLSIIYDFTKNKGIKKKNIQILTIWKQPPYKTMVVLLLNLVYLIQGEPSAKFLFA